MKNKPDWDDFWRSTRHGHDEIFSPIRYTGPEDFGDTPRSRRWALGTLSVALVLTVAVTALAIKGGERLDERAARQAQGAQAWMKKWPADIASLPVEGVAQCPSGPSPLCARVVARRTDLGGNEHEADLWLWPEQNWVRAWVPLAQWRLAHAAAISAPKSEHGQWLMRQETQIERNGERFDAQRKNADFSGASVFPDERGKRLWDMRVLRGPVASRVDRYADDEKGAPPALVMTETDGGAIALFEDGMELPARDENGQWFLLAQGSMSQSARLAAALTASPDAPFAKDPGEAARPAGWRWETPDESAGAPRAQALSDIAVAFGGASYEEGQRAPAKEPSPKAWAAQRPESPPQPLSGRENRSGPIGRSVQ